MSGAWRVVSPQGLMINKNEGTARHQSGSRVVVYRFNRNHLRGAAIPDEGIKVLCLGDSFTFGWLLNEPDTFVNKLQDLADRDMPAKRLRFLNEAQGAGALLTIWRSDKFGEEIAPAYVVVFLNFADISQLEQRSVSGFARSPRGVDSP